MLTTPLPPNTTPRQFMKRLQMVHNGMLLAVAALLIYCLYYRDGFEFKLPELSEYDSILLLLAVALAPVIGRVIRANQLKKARAASALKEKLMLYQSAVFASNVSLEGPALICFVVFGRNGNGLFFLFGLAMFLLLLFNRPNERKLISSLQPDTTQQARLQELDRSLDE